MEFITTFVLISTMTITVTKGDSTSALCNDTAFVKHSIRSPLLLSCDDSELKAEISSIRYEISSLEAELQQEIWEQKELIKALKDTIIPIGSSPYNPASNCSVIFDLPGPPATSGTYWLTDSEGSAVQVKCDFGVQLPPPSPVRGWQEIANIDLSDPNDSCPSPWREVTSPSRRCSKFSSSVGCESVTFPTNYIPFSRLCGRAVGYNTGTSDAFHSALGLCCRTVNDPYVDGVSITYLSPTGSRQHIWSLAAHHPDLPRCPCGNAGFTSPSFVGDNYYCESAVDDNSPLWEGEGCTDDPAASGDAPCCENPNFPWFCREFNQPIVTDCIEVRVCTDQAQSNEGVAFDLLKLYVQ